MANMEVTRAIWKAASGGTYAVPGVVTGGETGIADIWQLVHGANGVVIPHAGDIIATPTLSMQYTAATKALLAHAFRATYPKGAITETIYLMMGTDAVGWEYQNCAIDGFNINWTGPGLVTCDVNFIATKPVLQAGGVTDTSIEAGTTLVDQAGLMVSIGGAATYECVGFSYGLSNNYAHKHLAAGRSSASKRIPDGLQKGIEDLTLSLDVLVAPETALAADAPTHATGVVITMVDRGASPVTSTWTWTDLGVSQEPYALREREDGLQTTRINFSCKPGSLVLT